MMMCISGVTDFEAQLTASVERFARGSAEERELAARSLDWLVDRENDSNMLMPREPIEPSRPYSHGRRLIPARLAAERERCMPALVPWYSNARLAIGCVFEDDYTVAVRWK